jgi:hypothetical protein
MNKQYYDFMSAALKLPGVSVVDAKRITFITTTIICSDEDEELALRKQIYNLEVSLIASDPDAFYDFRVVRRDQPRIPKHDQHHS